MSSWILVDIAIMGTPGVFVCLFVFGFFLFFFFWLFGATPMAHGVSQARD